MSQLWCYASCVCKHMQFEKISNSKPISILAKYFQIHMIINIRNGETFAKLWPIDYLLSLSLRKRKESKEELINQCFASIDDVSWVTSQRKFKQRQKKHTTKCGVYKQCTRKCLHFTFAIKSSTRHSLPCLFQNVHEITHQTMRYSLNLSHRKHPTSNQLPCYGFKIFHKV